MSNNSRKTPYYLIDIKKVKKNYEELENIIKDSGRKKDIIAYSIKANYSTVIIKQLNELHSYFEVCSEYEYNILMKNNISKSKIVINGCFFNDFKKYKESILIIDSYSQLYNWINTYNCNLEIGIRVNLDCITNNEDDKRFVNKNSRFGIDFSSPDIKKLIKQINWDNVICLHCHLSGNSREPSIYKDIILELIKIRNEYGMKKIKYFDIGGGFKVGKDNGLWKYSDYVEVINETCPNDVEVIYELGNALVRECAEYHTKVIDVKKLNKEYIFVTDGSIMHIPKINHSKMKYRIEKSRKKNDQHRGNKIYGNTCKESDLLLKLNSQELLSKEDTLIIENVGAYSINEVKNLIIPSPNVYVKDSKYRMIGNLLFEYVCKYSDIKKNKNGKNDYSIINEKADGSGLYAFINCKGEILYIGVAYGRKISYRVGQHFRDKDSGSLKNKLVDDQKKELEDSSLYICKINGGKRELLFEEAYHIGLCKPKFNFLR